MFKDRQKWNEYVREWNKRKRRSNPEAYRKQRRAYYLNRRERGLCKDCSNKSIRFVRCLSCRQKKKEKRNGF